MSESVKRRFFFKSWKTPQCARNVNGRVVKEGYNVDVRTRGNLAR